MFGIFGNITNPFAPAGLDVPAYSTSTQGQGLITILASLLRLSVVLAGVYTLFNIILAGYGFLSAGGDPKLIQKSWERIWRSILGLVIVAGSYLIAMIIGWIIFGDINAIVYPRIYTP
jgi:hypothetical protein